MLHEIISKLYDNIFNFFYLYFVNNSRKTSQAFIPTVFHFFMFRMTHSKDVFFCRQIEMRNATKIKKAKNASLSKGLVLYIRVSFVIKFRGLLHYDKIIINTISILYQICFFALSFYFRWKK